MSCVMLAVMLSVVNDPVPGYPVYGHPVVDPVC